MTWLFFDTSDTVSSAVDGREWGRSQAGRYKDCASASRCHTDLSIPEAHRRTPEGNMVKRVAVLLSGCGVYDGTEVHEASAVLVQMFAPNTDQMHVVNHCEGKPSEGKRNVLQESARIARGDVSDLAKLDKPERLGGEGKDYTVQPQVEKIIKAFRQAGKPLGMCCISPVLAAKALPGCELTVGPGQGV
ncbi:hypothetical protein CRUP_036754 [Coryphaenoides rupestris]|nr:hypothetical protein CRUP_036754 [Coryphaenoides rupestris]